MSRAHPAAVLVPGALGACLALLTLGPGFTDAGPEAAVPPAARAGDVSFDAELVRRGDAALVRIRARSGDGRARACRITAELLRGRDARFSRVAAMPVRIWSEAVALRVPARGEASREVPVPAAAAAQLPSPRAGGPDGPVLTVQVRLVPACSEDAGVG